MPGGGRRSLMGPARTALPPRTGCVDAAAGDRTRPRKGLHRCGTAPGSHRTSLPLHRRSPWPRRRNHRAPRPAMSNLHSYRGKQVWQTGHMHLVPADRADHRSIDGHRACEAIGALGDPENIAIWAGKLRAIDAFASQVVGRAYLEPDLIQSTARYWSRYGGGRYAEAFEVVRDSAERQPLSIPGGTWMASPGDEADAESRAATADSTLEAHSVTP